MLTIIYTSIMLFKCEQSKR